MHGFLWKKSSMLNVFVYFFPVGGMVLKILSVSLLKANRFNLKSMIWSQIMKPIYAMSFLKTVLSQTLAISF